MTEQEILQDALIATKFLLSMNNSFGMECSNKPLRDLIESQHKQISKHNFEIFESMKKAGYYPVTVAPAKDLEQAIKMHSQMQQDLEEKLN
ncbi:MAG: spore coat protein [Clostridia bacterium]|nr:spore coat protein [Clostridia bacterium]